MPVRDAFPPHLVPRVLAYVPLDAWGYARAVNHQWCVLLGKYVTQRAKTIAFPNLLDRLGDIFPSKTCREWFVSTLKRLNDVIIYQPTPLTSTRLQIPLRIDHTWLRCIFVCVYPWAGGDDVLQVQRMRIQENHDGTVREWIPWTDELRFTQVAFYRHARTTPTKPVLLHSTCVQLFDSHERGARMFSGRTRWVELEFVRSATDSLTAVDVFGSVCE
jgi:hypothetical protein